MSELEAIYEDQVRTFTLYQSRLARHAIRKNRAADLVMVYFEQPDGSSHQFWLTDKLQATNPQDANTIGANQDQAKIARYHRYIENAYRRVDGAVNDIIDQVGRLPDGTPRSNVFVVSDHGFAPFNTAVSLFNLLKAGGIDTTKIAIKTSGPAANIYVNLAGRELNGAVPVADYEALVGAIADVLKNAMDTNPNYTKGGVPAPVFAKVASRPSDCGTPGFCTTPEIGQDFGDVFAIMNVGYNFDGTQNPGVARLGDPAFSSDERLFGAQLLRRARLPVRSAGHERQLPGGGSGDQEERHAGDQDQQYRRGTDDHEDPRRCPRRDGGRRRDQRGPEVAEARATLARRQGRTAPGDIALRVPFCPVLQALKAETGNPAQPSPAIHGAARSDAWVRPARASARSRRCRMPDGAPPAYRSASGREIGGATRRVEKSKNAPWPKARVNKLLPWKISCSQ